jgi:hypothetical protein
MEVYWNVPVRVVDEHLIVGKSHAFGPYGTEWTCCGLYVARSNFIREEYAEKSLSEPIARCKKCLRATF